MRDSYQPPRRRDPATRIGTALRGIRTADFRHPSKRMWRSAQLGALATVGFVALFARGTAAQTASAQSPQHPPAAPGPAAAPQSASAATSAPAPTLAPPAGVPAPAPSAVQTTSSGSSGAGGGDDDSGHPGRDGDGDGDD